MATLAQLEALVREHAEVCVQAEHLRQRFVDLEKQIEDTKRKLHEDGIIQADADPPAKPKRRAASAPEPDPDPDPDPEHEEEQEEEEKEEELPAATPEEVLELLRRHPIEWAASEFTDFIDVDPASVRPVLDKLVADGLARKVRKKYVIESESGDAI